MDIRQQITDDIIKALEAPGGVRPWSKGWANGQLAFNASSGEFYHGVNQFILGMQPYADARYLTYKQAQYMGLQVRKGEQGTRIIKVVEVNRRQAEQEAGDTGEVLANEGGRSLVLKAYTVFNATQIDGMAPLPARVCDVQPAEAVEAIVRGLQDTGMKLHYGGNQPVYRLRSDEIICPVIADFHSLEDAHASLLHECAHASGHPKRLARLHFDVQRGSSEYAREELRAELAAAMMTVTVGLPPPGPSMIESHASYVASWLEVLRRDKGEIFRAAADAQKICDYLSERGLAAVPKLPPQPTEDDSELVIELARGRKPRSPWRV